MTARVVSIGLMLAIPLGARAQVEPYIMIDVDTSGSMLCDACQSGMDGVDHSAECPGIDIGCGQCPVQGCWNGTPDDSRLNKVKIAVADVVNSFGDVTFGLARFAQTPNVFACNNTCGNVQPSGGWTGAAIRYCDGADPGQGSNAADVVVPFAEDNQIELLQWVDGCDNWPTVDDCDWEEPELLGGNTCAPGELCADCGTGCDKELRGSGFTALAGSLFSMREHIETVARPADPAAECRPYGVILLADGADNCQGEPELEAEQLCDVGVPTYSIGFGSCPLGCDDPCFNDCPGSTCPTRGITPEGCFGANDLPHPCVDDGDLFPNEPGECSVGCQLFCQTKEIAEFGCGPNCNTSAQGQQRCDGQPIFVEDETQMALAMAEIAQSAILRELCNGLDDDCDGLTDEDFPGLGDDCCDPCPGTIVCNATQDGTMCSGIGPPEINCPEVCNGEDDDCDTLIDEDLLCPLEVCDGIDNDGDGGTDELPLADVGQPCGTNEGECSMGETCCLDGRLECCGDTEPQQETCDCLDNNCNAETDENVFRNCYSGSSDECPDPESGFCLGYCKPGWQACETSSCPTSFTWGPCIGEIGPREEKCNCIDDNCNAIVDDGAICPGDRPCINCSCAPMCDPEAEFPCPAGFICNGNCGGEVPHVCIPAPCNGVLCEPGFVCDECSGECVSLCEGVECGDLECCGGDCCASWESCENLEDGREVCVDTSCTNPSFPCEDGQICDDHRCVDNPCSSVSCGPDQFCRDGECVSTCPVCNPDEICEDGRCVADPCAFVSCTIKNTVCCDGQCINDPCVAEVRCEPGEFCDPCTAACREDLCPVTRCPSGSFCRRNQCITQRAAGVSDIAVSGAGGCACEVTSAPATSGADWLALLGIVAAAGVARRRKGAVRCSPGTHVS